MVQGLSDKITHYNNLKHEVDTNRQFYESMLQRINEAGIASAVRQSNIRLVGPADYPLRPYKPNVMFNMAMGLLVSLVLGVGLVLYQEQGNQSLQAPGEASVYLRLPELGAIPKFEHSLASAEVAGRRERPWGDGANDGGQRLSYWSESFRGAVTSILSSSSNGDAPHVLVLTSSLPMEGKTTVTSNLGIALAEISEKVLLIDADVRAPRLHKLFNLDNSWGLSDLLCDTDHAEERPLESWFSRPDRPISSYCPPGHPRRISSAFCTRITWSGSWRGSGASSICAAGRAALSAGRGRESAWRSTPMAWCWLCGPTTSTRKWRWRPAQRLLLDGIPVLGTILNDWDLAGSREYGYGYGYGYGKRAS